MPPAIGRRRWFAGLFRSLAGAVVARAALPGLVTAAGCASEPEKPDSILRVPLEEIPVDGRVERSQRGVHVEFRRDGDAVVAISLMCSHQLCRIEWIEDDRRYLCPCHDGLFDENGDVVYGPPKRPLRRLDVVVEDGAATVDVHDVYRAAKRRQPEDARTTD